MDVTALNTTPSTSATAAKTAQDTQDRFLKLLVAQMQNQDPMNPMDNAQVTSQMAQIQTVSGISTLDSSVKSLASQFGQMQMLQSVSLVGREVSVAGNRLDMSSGAGQGSYELASPADAVKLEILSPAGSVIDTVQLGAQGAGRQDFTWPSTAYGIDSDLKYRITATKGAAPVSSTTFTRDTVTSVNASGGSLKLELKNLGLVDYASVTSFD
ncbi:flagellar hook assembly protein FlgD [Roseateles violae]|uniref:Basal-body rod modification protein FlgD n=1 Tax=Roseateles violae TaxID=3058042 RepID=A0ABT8DU18_9BURK|nr:flagellar hook capping FlgD N-terminal domain-containing protein [Pelomonas sp. PFR6]MDN3919814.1 flagellar hook capping FlgD N-terminal domain-containing protein [Pelomonas sp. PFR6]